MVDVINEGYTIHKIFAIRKEIHPSTGKEISKRQFAKDYVFNPGKIVKVPKEDFDKMVDKDDYLLGRIYTKEQWKARAALIEKQNTLEDELYSEEVREDISRQNKIRKELQLNDEERYLLLNNLPHEV